MANEAAPVEGVDESQKLLEAADAADAEAAATPAIDEATWKRRIAGKDQALTAAQKERDALKSQLADYQQKVAGFENASLTEVERLQKQITELEASRASAAAEATRLRLNGKFPLAFDTLGDRAPLDESALAEIESKLVALRGDTEEESRVDPNNPRRPTTGPKPIGDQSSKELEDTLKAFGNPLRDLGWGA